MNNKYLLDERLNIIGLSKDDLAKKLGINVKSLYRRLAGAQDFTQTELQKIKDVLNLNTDDFMKIFFVETKKFSVTGFKQLLGSTDWQHETIVDEKGIIIATDRDFTEHAKSWGYVTKISTLKDDFVIKYIRMYSYFNYMPDSLTYIAQNELGENLNLCYNGFEVVDDTGKSLNASEVESVVKQFSRFTKFDDVEYKYFDVVDVVGNGTHKTDKEIQQQLHGKRRRMRAIVQDAVQGPDAVTPADFFPFLIRSGLITDGAFIHTQLQARNKGCHFRFKAETVFLQLRCNSLNGLTAEQFVACFHIADIKIGKHV